MLFKTIGVVGCGTMGAGIAYLAAENGYEAVMLDVTRDAVERGLKSLMNFTDKSIERGKLTEEKRQDIFGRIHGTTEYGDFAGCDIVIEAASENIEIKKDIFRKLETEVDEKTILASNTSSLSITEIGQAVKTPERVIGIHFFNPPQLMKLVEIIKSDVTDDTVSKNATQFVESLGKTVINAKDMPGFIVNYLQIPFRLHAIRMVEEGLATPEDIDTAARLGLGHKMGPLELQDMVGLDITYNSSKAIYEKTGNVAFKPPELMEKMMKENLLGRKTGKGFYIYEK